MAAGSGIGAMSMDSTKWLATSGLMFSAECFAVMVLPFQCACPMDLPADLLLGLGLLTAGGRGLVAFASALPSCWRSATGLAGEHRPLGVRELGFDTARCGLVLVV